MFKNLSTNIFLIVFFINFPILSYGQIYKINDYKGQTVTTCAGLFYDSGGNFFNYSNNENDTITFCSSNGMPLSFQFTSFNTQEDIIPYDYLQAYDGSNTNAPILSGWLHGNKAVPFYLYSSGSCMTFVFHSDNATNRSGWSAIITCYDTTLYRPYRTNGNTVATGGNCYTLTGNTMYANGTIWYSQMLNLKKPFDIQFSMNFGNNSPNGADGMAFVMQKIGLNAIGSGGNGLGYGGTYFTPSLGIEFDTWNNVGNNDISVDHIAISRNGCVDHAAIDNIAGPIQADISNPSIKTGTNYPVRIKWTPNTDSLIVYFNCNKRLAIKYDIINSVFSGDTLVYWGFTASTGMYYNLHRVCLEPNILSVPSDITICRGDTANLDATGSSTGQYSWSPNYNLTNSTIQNPRAFPDSTTTYYVTFTDLCGFSIRDSITVFVNTITIDSTINNVLCYTNNTGSISITPHGGTPPYLYSWSNGKSNQTISMLTANTYSLSITDANSCSVTAEIQITEPTKLSINITGNDASAIGMCDATATATGIGGITPYQYQWNYNAGTNAVAGNLCADTNYIVTITDNNGCTATGIYIPKYPGALLLTISGTNPLCANTCEGTATANITGGTLPYTFWWSNNKGTNAVASALCPDTIYYITVTDNNGITVSGSFTPTNPTPINITFSSNNPTCYELCNGSITASVSNGIMPYTYLWSNGFTNTSISSLCAESTPFSITVTDANNCSSVNSHTLINPSQIILQKAAINPLCNNQCTGTATVNASGGQGMYSYLWSNGQTTSTSQNLCAQIYSVTVTDANNCSTVDTIHINSTSDIAITIIKNAPTCYDSCNASLQAIVTGGTGIYFYTWNNGISNHTISGLCGGSTYIITVTDANNCTKTNSSMVELPKKIEIQFGSLNNDCNNDDLCDGTIYTQIMNSTATNLNYLWNNGETTSILYKTCIGTSYSVTVTDNLNGCITIDSIFIPDCLVIPNTFTPNNDGKNDEWKIRNIEKYPKAEVTIFNRWGQVIFQTSHYTTKDQWWDGTYNGVSVSMGAYIYIINLNNGSPPLKGIVNVIY